MKAGEIILDKQIPMMEIVGKDDKVLGYLAPFRGYRFQVMGNQQGEGDYGSSPVLGLGNIVLALKNYQRPEETGKCHTSLFSTNSNYANGEAACQVMYSIAMDALYQFMSHRPIDSGMDWDFNSQLKLRTFIGHVYNFLAEQLEIPKIEVR